MGQREELIGGREERHTRPIATYDDLLLSALPQCVTVRLESRLNDSDRLGRPAPTEKKLIRTVDSLR